VSLVLADEPPDAPAAAALLAGFAAEIAGLYPGWDPAVGPSADPEDFAPPAGAFLVAYEGDRAVACGGLKRLDDRHVEVKRVFVAPEARGRKVARRLLDGLERTAADRGYEVLRLDTGDRQPAALALFRALGYTPIGDYNDNPYASHWLEKPVSRDPGRAAGRS
jgi:GNAT superfamily N-acetyltransferase